jgi:hypothetical protein
VPNLYIVDGSSPPTGAAVNPTSTISATMKPSASSAAWLDATLHCRCGPATVGRGFDSLLAADMPSDSRPGLDIVAVLGPLESDVPEIAVVQSVENGSRPSTPEPGINEASESYPPRERFYRFECFFGFGRHDNS